MKGLCSFSVILKIKVLFIKNVFCVTTVVISNKKMCNVQWGSNEQILSLGMWVGFLCRPGNPVCKPNVNRRELKYFFSL